MKLKYFVFSILAVILLNACTTELDLKLDGTSPVLVVDGAITSDVKTHTIYLKKTADYFSNKQSEGISGALVTVNDGQQTITLTEDSNIKGAYHTPVNYHGTAGRNYTLNIENLDVNGDGVLEKYTASCYMNSVPTVDSIKVSKVRLFGNDMWALKESMQDPENQLNYYLMRNYRNDICVSDSINEWGITPDEFFNGVYLIDETFMYFSSTKKDEILQTGDKITLELCGITRDYMFFINEMREEFQGRNPLFGGQPANVRTNIKQIEPTSKRSTPCGYFAVYSVNWTSIIYDE